MEVGRVQSGRDRSRKLDAARLGLLHRHRLELRQRRELPRHQRLEPGAATAKQSRSVAGRGDVAHGHQPDAGRLARDGRSSGWPARPSCLPRAQ